MNVDIKGAMSNIILPLEVILLVRHNKPGTCAFLTATAGYLVLILVTSHYANLRFLNIYPPEFLLASRNIFISTHGH